LSSSYRAKKLLPILDGDLIDRMNRDFFDATHFRGKTPKFLLPVVNQLKGAL
jgi:hypothetical protein